MSPAAMVAQNSPSSSPSAPFARPPCAPRKSASASGNTALSPTTSQVLLPSRSASLPSMRLPIASISSSSSPTTLSTKPSALAATASSPPAPQPLCPNQISPKPTQPRQPRPKQPSPSRQSTPQRPLSRGANHSPAERLFMSAGTVQGITFRAGNGAATSRTANTISYSRSGCPFCSVRSSNYNEVI